jgi:hypothetical protein
LRDTQLVWAVDLADFHLKVFCQVYVGQT